MEPRLSGGLPATNATRTYAPPAEATRHFREGRPQEAIAACYERLAEAPDDVGALQLLAGVFLHEGQGAVAALLLEQALKSAPDDPSLRARLGTALASEGSVDAAVAAYKGALAEHPGTVEAHLGMLELGRSSELEQVLAVAAEADPTHPSPPFGMANLLLDRGEHDDAADHYRRAVELDPTFRNLHVKLGTRLALTRQEERAARVYRWGLALNPDDPELHHMVRALDGDASETRASDDYVASHFDAFADRFEEQLVGQLEYRPQSIVDALRGCLDDPASEELAVLDAGCGTGLCGPLLRPFARRLVGVDLSAGMLEHAAASEVYDELRVAELVSALAEEPASYDVIVAADVLIYFGSLEAMFEAAASALRPGGLLAVSAERHDGEGWTLSPNGRYAHSEGYLRATSAAAGLAVRDLSEWVCRLEMGVPVDAYIAVLERPFVPLPGRS